MATYKLIQNVEAEDHILGPLTLRQFIFALIAIFSFYICYVSYVKHVAFLLILFMPPGLFFGFFAIPFGRDQPTEIWALAKIRFFILPRKRVWNQSGVKELVTITAPKKVERNLTNGLSQNEVANRLNVLAQTLDSRGWAVKNFGFINDGQNYVSNLADNDDSDRLIDVSSLPQAVDDTPNDTDILDENNSPISRQFEQMINQTTRNRHQQLIDQMNTQPAPQAPAAQTHVGNNQWFMPTAANKPLPVSAPEVPAQVETAEEEALVNEIIANRQKESMEYGNLRTLHPKSSQTIKPPPPQQTTPDPAIISLANNDDLSVSTIAHEAHKAKDKSSDDEVVITLH